jgi:hypothetical protein
MSIRHSRVLTIVFVFFLLYSWSLEMHAQGAKQSIPESKISDSDADHIEQRNAWFFRGRLIRGKPSAELRRRAYQAKLRLRAARAAALRARGYTSSPSTVFWTPLGPAPLASDATGNGTQDYHQVAGRATAVAIDPADSSGNTVYIGGAQSGVWKSTNAANPTANIVTWTPLTDDQPTLSIGAIAIQPGNNDPTRSVILAATGEANNSGDSYFGLGILRSADGGNSWTLIPSANSGALSFSGLGGTRMAFSSATPNTVVAAMATSSEGIVAGAINSNTSRGLYTSADAGQTWTYNALLDSGVATDATSATSVVYNATAGLFFAAVRYHGFYSSPDGVTWTRLANQPGGSALSPSACPPQSTSNGAACPIYRAEVAVVPGRNEMYTWYVYFSSTGELMDGGIWQTLNGATTAWTQINDTGISNCGDYNGCGIEQGTYNLELAAVPNGSTATDLYAGSINLYKCSLSSLNPACSASPFINLTHVYGCDPIAAPAHVHPDQHALAFTIPTAGNALMYFANDGGIYRAINGFSGLTTGSCSGANQFDDLNQNLGSMTQFVGFSQHPSDLNTLLGGTQDNGSPATNQATSNSSWGNVLGGDGGYNAIDPNATSNFYASNPDIPPGGLAIQRCTSGVNCTDSSFSAVVTSSTIGGDDGAFYFPYILDPQSSSTLLVGTCRVWRGPRSGGAYTALSPNFDTLGSGTCSGSEVNQVRAIAAGGATDSNGSTVLYATTSGYGPTDGPLYYPTGGHIWVTTNATAGPSTFVDITNNGPQGSINPNQFPVSSVVIDTSDASGQTAFVTVMGFTAAPGSTSGPGHVWKTTNAGSTWIDFTGNLPDSPANAAVIDPSSHTIYLGTDVGVFSSSTVGSPSWTEVGPAPGSTQTGFLPNVAVTALGLFNSAGQEYLRASTYGRGIWQFNLHATPDYQLAISNSPLNVLVGQNAVFNGTATALNGYSNSVTMQCVAGSSPPPGACTISPTPLTPGSGTSFTVTAGGPVGDYYFNVQGVGADPNQTTRQVAVTLHVLSGNPDFSLSEPTAFPTVNAGSTNTSGAISITAQNGFTGTISLACSLVSGNGICSVNPSTITSIPASPNVSVNAASLAAGSYLLLVQGTSGSTTHSLAIPFNVGDYQLSGTQSLALQPGTQGTANLILTPTTYYGGRVNATCDPSSLAGATCSLNPGNPISVNTGSPASLAASISVPAAATPGVYSVNINTQDTSGTPSHSLQISVAIGDFSLRSSTPSQTVNPGQTTSPYQLTIAPNPTGSSFPGVVTLSCAGLPAGAQCSFNPSTPITPGNIAASVAMTISTNSSTTAGTYTITVTGTSGSLSHPTTVTLLVASIVSSNSLELAVTQPFPASVDAGSSPKAKVALTGNYSGSVNVTCDASSMPGAQCSITPGNPVSIAANTPVTLTLTLNIPSTAAVGPYTFNVNAADSSGQPGASLPSPLTLSVMQDFSVSSATISQTVTAGQTTGPYQLSIAPNPQGSSFSGAVTLSCTKGLPAGAQCLFNPSAPQTLTNGPVDVVMTISTVAPTARSQPLSRRLILYTVGLFLPGIGMIWIVAGKSKRRKALSQGAALTFLVLTLTLILASCGGASSGGGTTPPPPPNTYAITITGTSGSLSHSATVNLVVQ